MAALSRLERDSELKLQTGAPVISRRSLRTARQCMSPMEGRGVVAVWDRRLEQLVLTTSTQMPHIVRTGLAGCLGLSEEQVRVLYRGTGKTAYRS